MRRFALLLTLALFLTAAASYAQEPNIIRKDLSQPEIDRILKKVSENESLFREALKNYIFSRSASISTVGMGGQITGTYRRDSMMTFNEDGSRFEKITFFPEPTLVDLQITPEDLEDLGGVNPFALEPSAMSQYNFTYVGMEHIDELMLYVFDVRPKEIPDPKHSKLRLFTGRIWVDDHDLMIVKSKGKAVPETKVNKFPVVETWRENIDGKYWFPTYAESHDDLVFDNGVIRLKMIVKYTDYKLGRTDVKILDDVPDPTPSPSPTPKKP